MHDFTANAEVLDAPSFRNLTAMLFAMQSPNDFVLRNPPALLHNRGTKP